MADIVVTAAKVGAVFSPDCLIRDIIAGVTITAGQAVSINTSGKLVLADGSTGTTLPFRGIALKGGGAGEVIPVLIKGWAEGFAVSALDADVLLYVSATAGALADAAAGVEIQAGRVFVLSNASATKIVWIDTQVLGPVA